MLFKGLSVREPAPLAPGRVGGVAAALTVVVTAGARHAQCSPRGVGRVRASVAPAFTQAGASRL